MVKKCSTCKRNVVWVDSETVEKVCCYCHAASVEAIALDPVAAANQIRALKEALGTAIKWWSIHREEAGVTSGIEETEFVECMTVKNE